MAADAKLQIIGDSSKAEAAIVALEKKFDKLEGKLKQTGRVSRRTSKEAVSGFQSVTASARGVAAAIGLSLGPLAAVSAAVNVLKREYGDLKRRQDAALQSSITFGAALRQTILNAPNQKPKDVEAAILRISAKTGATPTQSATALSATVSAKGNLSFADAGKATTATLRLVPDIPESQAPIAGAALDIRKVFPKATSKDAIQFALALQSRARVETTAESAENVLTGAIELAREGKTPLRTAGAFTTALTSGSTDKTGKTSKNAAISFSEQAREMFPELFASGGIGPVIEHLQNDPEARKKFLEKATFRVQQKGAIRAVLNPDSKLAKEFAETQAVLPKLIGAGKGFDQRVAEIDAVSSIRAAKTSRTFGVAAEQLRLRDTKGAVAGATRKGLEDVLSASGVGQFERDATLLAFDLNSRGGTRRPIQSAIDELENIKKGNLVIKKAEETLPGRFIRYIVDPNNEGEDRLSKENEKLQKLIDSLEGLKDIQRQMLEDQRRQPKPRDRNVHRER